MKSLLGENELHPAHIINEHGTSPIVLICEHASNVIPESLNNLGLSHADRQRHIAWDIGAEGVSRHLSALLDAPLFLQNYSRLVYDCNRSPENPSAMPEVSEIFEIPGNKALSPEFRLQRTQEIYRPFMVAVTEFLDHRAAHGRRAVPVSIHSFTRVYQGKERKVELGLLCEHDETLAKALLHAFPEVDTQINEPYGPQHGVMHLMNLLASPRGLQHLMIEIRNDLIETETGQKNWAETLAPQLKRATA